MFKKMLCAASCVAVLSEGAAMDKRDLVDNPIPILIMAVSPTFLDGESYDFVRDSLEKSTSEFKTECEKSMKLPSFPENLAAEWKEKLALLMDTGVALRAKRDITEIYQKLVETTDNGFLTSSRVAIYGTENSEIYDKILDSFWQHLWQARELTEYIFILSEKQVSSSKIPETFESLDRTISGIRRLSPSKVVEEDAYALEGIISKILVAYQYPEHGRAVKTPANLQQMQNILPKNQKLREIMLGVFDTSTGN